jgi:hypothetical protein
MQQERYRELDDLLLRVVLTQVEVVLHAVAHDQDSGNGVEQSCFGSVSILYR